MLKIAVLIGDKQRKVFSIGATETLLTLKMMVTQTISLELNYFFLFLLERLNQKRSFQFQALLLGREMAWKLNH